MRTCLAICLLGWVLPLFAQTAVVDSLRQAIDQPSTRAERAWTMMRYVSKLQSVGIRDSTDVWSERILGISKPNGMDSLTAIAYCALLNHNFTTTEDHVEEIADSAIHYLHRAGDVRREAEIRGTLGYWLCSRFNCPAGLAQLAHADSLFTLREFPIGAQLRGLSRYRMSLEACEQPELALALMPKGIALAKRLKYKDQLRQQYHAIGQLHLTASTVDSARHYLALMKELLPKLRKDVSRVGILTFEAEIAMEVGNYQEALGITLESIQRMTDGGFYYDYSAAPKRMRVGVAAYHLGRLQFSLRQLRLALPYYQESGNERELAELSGHLGNVHAALGDLATARHYQYQKERLTDSLQRVRHEIQLDRLMTEFETERVRGDLVQSDRDRLQAEARAERYRLIGLSIGLVLLLGAFAYVIALFRQRQKQLAAEKTKAELNYALLRAQMSPHFIFNSLNSIQSFFSNRRFTQGNEYLAKFSTLIRRILDQSAQPYITLVEELETLELYLELERERMGDNLTYQITVDPNIEVDLCEVPPLIFQPFVENAIWHGIAPKLAPGRIHLSLEPHANGEAIRATIVDDGVGLQRNTENSRHQSKGVEITRARLGRKGSVSIEDRKLGAGETGVRAEIIIPLL